MTADVRGLPVPPDPHGPPGDLDTDARALYRKLRDFLKKQGTWENSDRYILGQTCRYEQRARLARGAMYDPELRAFVLTTEGYKGQDVKHPNLATAEAAEKSFVDGLRELGLTPRARKQLEIEVAKGAGGKFGGALG